LFWKKKQADKTRDVLEIEFDLDRRSYFRVTPAPDKPVVLSVGGTELAVADVSAGGVALVQPGLPKDKRLSGDLWLPDQETPLKIGLIIVRSSADAPTSCQLEEISEPDQERLHQYVLERQKSLLHEQQMQRIKRYRERGGKQE
jgi:hypothetical protein